MNPIDSNAEWLEADGLGGFASGTVSGIRTRRYHALLLTATTPPAGRMVLVNGFDAWVETPSGTFAISSQRYGPDVIHPDGASRIESFEYDPWPRWRYKIDDLVDRAGAVRSERRIGHFYVVETRHRLMMPILNSRCDHSFPVAIFIPRITKIPRFTLRPNKTASA